MAPRIPLVKLICCRDRPRGSVPGWRIEFWKLGDVIGDKDLRGTCLGTGRQPGFRRGQIDVAVMVAGHGWMIPYDGSGGLQR